MVRSLTLLQHALLVVLTVVCAGRAVSAGAPLPALVAATALFLGWYVVGLAISGRRLGHGVGEDVTGPGAGGGAGAASSAGADVARHAGAWWLLGLTVCWLLLVAVSGENAWIAFTLWLLAGHFLRWRWAIPYTVAVLGVVALALSRDSGSLTVAEVLGPAIGALFALAVSRGQIELVRESLERQRLIASLVATQAEAEALATELAATQRESGVLAERARLSRDIHDTLAQGFSSIVLLARAGGVTPTEGGVRDLLRRIEGTAADNLDEARRVVGALAPRDLEGAGLSGTLRRLLDTLTDDTGIDTHLRVDGELAGLPTAVEVALVRTAQGALANVRRHSGASRVVVTLADEGDAVRLDIVDDGVGFDAEAVASRGPSPASGGYGLPSTRARLRELGGGLDVESAPGDGTALSAHVPLGGGES